MGDAGERGASYICIGSPLAPAVTHVAVAYGKDLWKKEQIPVTMKLVKDACAEVYVVLMFWLVDKSMGWRWAWLCSLLDGSSTECVEDGCDNIHLS